MPYTFNLLGKKNVHGKQSMQFGIQDAILRQILLNSIELTEVVLFSVSQRLFNGAFITNAMNGNHYWIVISFGHNFTIESYYSVKY